jgi:hypothetical protein
MITSSHMPAGVAQGFVGAQQIKIQKSANSSHGLRKAILQPSRAREGGQRLATVCSYGRDPKFGQGSKNNQQRKSSGMPRRSPPSQETIKVVVREYAIPAIGVFALATILGPLIGAVAFSAFGIAIAIASVVAAFSLSWIFIPVILSFMGLPLLFGGGIATSLFAGAAGVLLFPTLLNIGLITAAVFLGLNVARSFFYSNEDDFENNNSNGTIDIEVETVDDTLERDMDMEAERMEQELREFDELLKRRERFQRGGGKY